MTVPAPVEFVEPAAAAAGPSGSFASHWLEYLAGVGTPLLAPAIAAVFIVTAALMVRRLLPAQGTRPLNRAFAKIASRAGLSKEERGAVLRAAEAAGVESPTTLLLSDRALQQAVFAFVRSGAEKPERRALDGLMRRRGVIPEDVLPAGATLPRFGGADRDAPTTRLNAVA